MKIVIIALAFLAFGCSNIVGPKETITITKENYALHLMGVWEYKKYEEPFANFKVVSKSIKYIFYNDSLFKQEIKEYLYGFDVSSGYLRIADTSVIVDSILSGVIRVTADTIKFTDIRQYGYYYKRGYVYKDSTLAIWYDIHKLFLGTYHKVDN
jgi:hypothetical protein